LRFHDYTLPVAPDHRAPAWSGLTPDNVGGLDAFLKVIETEIKPRVAQLVPVDTANAALFGHSIGGLAVLRALFTEPGAFRTFIAASPSIWWDADAVLAGEAPFGKIIRSRSAAPRVLITVGANETNPSDIPQAFLDSLPADKATQVRAFAQMTSHWSGMVSGARDLATRLARIPGAPDYKVTFVAFAEETHGTVSPAALSRGMWFAFAP
jgi:predicted alpha/beta superfamily hydrolase